MFDLNKGQKEAVLETEGYIRVIAGAGTGKTRTLTSRFVHIVKELGINISKVLSVTFTNKAANEMKKRIKRELGDVAVPFVTTFHSLCHRILTDEIKHLNYPSNFQILDEEDKKSILETIYTELNMTLSDNSYRHFIDAISVEKNFHVSAYIEMLIDPAGKKIMTDNQDKDFQNVYMKFLEMQRKNFMLDFDDLINFTLYLFEKRKDVLEKWQKQFEYIQVDEFQDVSKKEYSLVSYLAMYHNNLFVVGDPDQTIYTWRGADINIFLDFDKNNRDVKTIYLFENYRSTQEILNVSNSLIKHNINRLDNELKSKLSGNKPIYLHSSTKENECENVALRIKDLVNKNVKYSDIAILYRGAYFSRGLENIFMKKNIPYVIYNGVEFYKRKEIKDSLAYLKMLVFGDDVSFLRTINCPKRNFGKKKIEYLKSISQGNLLYDTLKNNVEKASLYPSQFKAYIDVIEEYRNNKLSISKCFDEVLKKSGYEKMLMTSGDQERLDNINELKNYIYEYEENYGEDISLEQFLNEIALLSNSDKSSNNDKVKMMTVHTAKGLEFPYVFVCGLNEGIFPSRKTQTIIDMEEERRIAYVAFTRAQKELYFTDAEGFDAINSMSLYPSRFIVNVDKEAYQIEGTISEEFWEEGLRRIETIDNGMKNMDDSNYEIGDFVEHKIFGVGEIMDKTKEGYVIKFDKKTRTFSYEYKELKKVIENGE